MRGALALALVLLGGCAARPAATPAPAPAAAPAVSPSPSPTAATPREGKIKPRAIAAFERGLSQLPASPDEARQSFALAVSISPDYHLAHYNLGVLAFERRDLAAARAAFLTTLALEPRYGPAAIGLAAVMEQQGQSDGAAMVLQKVARQNPHDLDVRAALGQVWARIGKLDEAEDEARGMLLDDARQAGAMVTLGMVFRRQGKVALARLALERALGVEPTLGGAHHELGLLALAEADLNLAAAAFEQAAANGAGAAAYNDLSLVYDRLGSFELALAAASKAVSLRPDMAEYQLTLGNVLQSLKRYADAAAAYQKAYETGKGTTGALYNLGTLLLEHDVPGMTRLVRLQRSVEYLQSFAAQWPRPSADDLATVAELVEKAQAQIEAEKKRAVREGAGR